MYKSPIEAIFGEIKFDYDNEILKAVQEVGINVDKEALLKALEYDRNQYDKGYREGYEACKNNFLKMFGPPPQYPGDWGIPEIPEECRGCSNHPINGGSGICHCTLGHPKIY